MIRFGVIVSVVVAAVALLIVGAVAGDLKLVYGSIGLAALALLLLIIGVAVWRDQVFAGSDHDRERGLAGAGAIGQAGRLAGGPVTAQDWQDRLASAPGGPGASAGSGPGGDTRELAVPVGAVPERDGSADRYPRADTGRPSEQLQRPADPVGGPGREAAHRERYGREPLAAERPAREEGAERPAREEAAERPAREQAAADRPGQQTPSAERPARDPVAVRRTDRVELYPTMTGPERFEPADDPTRLAHRLDSLADIGRQHGPDAGGSARSQASRPGAARPPARAGSDPLAGPGADRRSAGEPLSGPPSQSVPGSRPAGPDLASAGRADTPVPAAAVPSAAASAAPVSAATVPASTAPAIADPVGPEPPSARAATLRPDGPDEPAQAGPGRAAAGRARTDGATAGSVDTVSADEPGGARAGAAPAGPTAAHTATTAADTAATAAGTATAAADTAATAAGAATAAAAAATAGEGSDTAPAVSPDDVVSVVPGIARYHKADCILIRFLSEEDLELTSRREAEAAGSAPCRACRPDRPSATS
jgi:hypothetical protein